MKKLAQSFFTALSISCLLGVAIGCGGEPAAKVKKEDTASTGSVNPAPDASNAGGPTTDTYQPPANNPGLDANSTTGPEEGWCNEICTKQSTCVGEMACQGVTMDVAGCVQSCVTQVTQDVYNAYAAATCDDINTGACQQDPQLADVCNCPEVGSCTDASLSCVAAGGGLSVCVTSTNAAPATATVCDNATPCAANETCVAFEQNATSGFCLENC